MAGIQRDVIINYQADPSALIAASQKAQAAINGTADASAAASDKATKAAEKAAAQQAKAAEKAAADQARAAEKAAKAAATEAEKVAREQERIAEEAARAAERLADLASQGSDIDRLTRSFEKQKAEIEALEKTTGDQESAQKALTAATARYEAEVKKIKDAQEEAAKAAQKAANVTEEAQGDAADAAEKAAKANAEAAERSADGFGKVGESAGKLGGVLEMLGIEGAQNIADLADAGELASEAAGALGVSMTVTAGAVAALAVAATAAYGVWTVYAAEAEHAQQVQDRLNATLAAGQAASEELAGMNEQLAVATGNMTAEEAAYRAAVRETEKAREARMDAIAEEVGLTRQQIDLAYDAAKASRQAYDSLSETQKRAVGLIGIENVAQEKKVEILGKTRDAEISSREATEKKTASDKAAADAQRVLEARLRKTTETLRESAAAVADSNATAATYQGLLGQITAITDDYQTSLLVGADAIEAARAKEQASLLAIYQQTIANAQASSEAQAANEAYTDARASIDAKYAAQQQELADEQAAKLAENHALALQYQQEETASLGEAFTERAAFAQSYFDAYLSTYADAIGQVAQIAADFSEQALEESVARLDQLSERRDALTEQQKDNAKAAQEATDAVTRSELEAANAILAAKKDALKEQSKEERQQAMKAFRINQAIQIAQAVAGSALAVLNAFATVPYPASIAAAAAATATGAATIATVAAQKPQFHQGGIIQANVLPGEGVANRDLVRAVGEPTFNAMNRNPEAAAQALSGGGTTLVIGRQAIGEIGRNLMVGRSPVAQAINGRARPGQLALGTSNLPVLS